MATMKYSEIDCIARNAGADLSGKTHYLAKLNSSEEFVLAGDGEHLSGTIFEADAQNYPVTVQTGGFGKVICGTAITAGQSLASDANGKAAPATTGEYIFGVAMNGGAANEIIEFQFARGGRAA